MAGFFAYLFNYVLIDTPEALFEFVGKLIAAASFEDLEGYLLPFFWFKEDKGHYSLLLRGQLSHYLFVGDVSSFDLIKYFLPLFHQLTMNFDQFFLWFIIILDGFDKILIQSILSLRS